jgi:hypothetical protein
MSSPIPRTARVTPLRDGQRQQFVAAVKAWRRTAQPRPLHEEAAQCREVRWLSGAHDRSFRIALGVKPLVGHVNE